MIPLLRYLWSRYCSNLEHIVNSEKLGNAAGMKVALWELITSLHGIMRKLKNVHVLGSVEALGIIPDLSGTVDSEDVIPALWDGADPVHSTVEANHRLVEKVISRAETVLEEQTPVAPPA